MPLSRPLCSGCRKKTRAPAPWPVLSPFDSFVVEAKTAKKRLLRYGSELRDEEFFSPPLVLIGVAFLVPDEEGRCDIVVGSNEVFLEDRKHIESTKEWHDALKESFR